MRPTAASRAGPPLCHGPRQSRLGHGPPDRVSSGNVSARRNAGFLTKPKEVAAKRHKVCTPIRGSCDRSRQRGSCFVIPARVTPASSTRHSRHGGRRPAIHDFAARRRKKSWMPNAVGMTLKRQPSVDHNVGWYEFSPRFLHPCEKIPSFRPAQPLVRLRHDLAYVTEANAIALVSWPAKRATGLATAGDPSGTLHNVGLVIMSFVS